MNESRKELKVIIDTNILVSILKGSKYLLPIYLAFKNDDFTLVIVSEQIKELSEVLFRPKLKIETARIKNLFRLLKSKALYHKITLESTAACRDPKDNFILQSAIESKAEYIVTGDKDLLVLNPFRGVSIVSPKEFIDVLHS